MCARVCAYVRRLLCLCGAQVVWFGVLYTKTVVIYNETCSPLWSSQLCSQWVFQHSFWIVWLFLFAFVFSNGLYFVVYHRSSKYNALRSLMTLTAIHGYLSVIWSVTTIFQHLWSVVPFILLALVADPFMFWFVRRLSLKALAEREFEFLNAVGDSASDILSDLD